jgi:hypothetical protein
MSGSLGLLAVYGVIVFFMILGWSANVYVWSQWFVYPKMRQRFWVCKPYLMIGWGLWFVGGSVLQPLGTVERSGVLRGIGGLIGLVGVCLTLFAALRLLRANAAERRAARAAAEREIAGQTMPGAWPPPPTQR